MKRLLKIYRMMLSQNIKALMEYRIDFIIGALSFMIDQAVGIGFIFIIFYQIPQLGGFTLDQIVFIYGFSLIPKGLDHMFTDNLWNVGYFIVQKGQFDKYLTRPISPLFYVIAEKFQIDAAGELIMGIVLVCISAGSAGVRFTWYNVLLFIVAVIFASMIYTAIKLGTAALAFRIKVSGQIIQVFYMTNEFAKYPAVIYGNVIKFIITYVVPFAFTGYYPCVYFMTGENPLFNIGGLVVISGLLTFIALIIWQTGLKAYESAGS